LSTLVKWVLGSRWDHTKNPGTHRDHAEIPLRRPVFTVRSFLGRISAAHLGKNPAGKSVHASIPPRKKKTPPGSRRESCQEAKSW